MSAQAIVVPRGEGQRVGNVEFLARTVDTPRFTFGVIDFAPGRTMEQHSHDDEDDAFYIHAPAGFDRRIGLVDPA